jgi:hypothetical protein
MTGADIALKGRYFSLLFFPYIFRCFYHFCGFISISSIKKYFKIATIFLFNLIETLIGMQTIVMPMVPNEAKKRQFQLHCKAAFICKQIHCCWQNLTLPNPFKYPHFYVWYKLLIKQISTIWKNGGQAPLYFFATKSGRQVHSLKIHGNLSIRKSVNTYFTQ